MKLVLVFLLAAIPVCCYADGSSGCNALDDVISQSIDSSVTVDEYIKTIDSYVFFPYNKEAVKQFKQCFLDQSEETLQNVAVMVDAIYNSEDCPQSS